jgi:hypothetical protein
MEKAFDILPSARYDCPVAPIWATKAGRRMTKKKNPAAQALGQLGGKARAKALSAAKLSEIGRKGAEARRKSLTAAERSQIAKKAVQARIAKHKQQSRNKPKAKKGGSQ